MVYFLEEMRKRKQISGFFVIFDKIVRRNSFSKGLEDLWSFQNLVERALKEDHFLQLLKTAVRIMSSTRTDIFDLEDQ